MVTQELPLVLQLDIGGNPVRWITYEDSCYYYSKNLVAYTLGDRDYTVRGGICAATGERSTLPMNTIIAVKGKPDASADVSLKVSLSNKTLFRRDQNLCAYCGIEFSTSHLTRDHIHPTSKGGLDVWMNVVTACEGCNKAKDDRTPEQAHMRLLYVPYEPSRGEYLILLNRRILSDQMEFLLSKVPKNSRIRDNVKFQ